MWGMLLLLACGGAGGETIDIMEGLYRGNPADGKPENGVSTPDPDTTFDILFYEHGHELWADIALNGTMHIHGFKVTDEEDTVEGVTVDGIALRCALTVEGIGFKVNGTFANDRASLAIDVQHVGQMTLFLVAEEEPDTADTASDAGAD